MRNRNSGMSIIELVAVLVISSLLVAVAIPKIAEKQPFDVQNTTDSLLQDIRLTQLLAMSLNETCRIQLNNHDYQIFTASGTFFHPVSGSAPTLTAENIMITPALSLSFDALGTPMIGGTPLSSNQTIAISGGSTTKTLLLQAETGFASENQPQK